MGMFKSDEEKAAAAKEREATQRAAEEMRRRERNAASFAGSEIGRARAAFEAGDAYFQAQVSHDDMRSERVERLRSYARDWQPVTGTDMLGGICDEGWRLIQAGWVHRVKSEESRALMFGGQETVVAAAEVVGMFLFERDERARVVGAGGGAAAAAGPESPVG